ncbi:MAG: glycosyl hydrolase family 32, partial [Phycisphaerae bacterium]
CLPVRADRTLQAVAWKGAGDLASIAGKPVRFRFHLRSGQLYAFWVSPEKSGASHGYVAAGGPGFTGPTDTVGAAAARHR